jgi:DNA invertase Pin-like site-specific DNA recombinase
MDADAQRVVGYARVSHSRQLDGVSLEAQEARIRAYAIARGWTIDEVLVEKGRSGRNLRRPMLERLLADVRGQRVSHVIVFKLDRISRSVADLLRLLELFKSKAVSFVSVCEVIDTSSSMGEFIFTLLAAVARLESMQIGERTSVALRHLRSQGLKCGKVPWGWVAKGNKVVPVAAEQRALAEAKKMREQGKSWNDIGQLFASRGLPPRGGGDWYPSSVRQVLMSRMSEEQTA